MIENEVVKGVKILSKHLKTINRTQAHRTFYTYTDIGLKNSNLDIKVSYLFETRNRYPTLRFDLDDTETKRTLYSILIKDFSDESIKFALANVREYGRKFLCALDFE